jgi:hypothetical protein
VGDDVFVVDFFQRVAYGNCRDNTIDVAGNERVDERLDHVLGGQRPSGIVDNDIVNIIGYLGQPGRNRIAPAIATGYSARHRTHDYHVANAGIHQGVASPRPKRLSFEFH